MFVSRLKRIIERAGSIVALAEKANVANSTIHLWLNGSEPSREKLVALARGVDVSLEWLASGRGQMESPGEVLNVPVFNFQALNPPGIVVRPGVKPDWPPPAPDLKDATPTGIFPVPLNWAREALPEVANLDQLAILRGYSGTAMMPTIGDNDLLLIDLSDRMPRYDAAYIFLIRRDVWLGLCRLIQDKKHGLFTVFHDNGAFDHFNATLEGEPSDRSNYAPIKILGRVVWITKRATGMLRNHPN